MSAQSQNIWHIVNFGRKKAEQKYIKGQIIAEEKRKGGREKIRTREKKQGTGSKRL